LLKMSVEIQPGERSERVKNGSARPHCIVIGLGNPILGDDGIGWRVAEMVQARLSENSSQESPRFDLEVEFETLSLGGLSLMEHLIGFQSAIIIDAISSGRNPIGTVTRNELTDFDMGEVNPLNSAHDTSLFNAIQVGRSLEAELPERIAIVSIEIEVDYQFRESLSEAVAASIPTASDLALEILGEFSLTSPNGG